MDKSLQIGDGELTAREVQAIIDRLVLENPNMTIKDYLEKRHKIKGVLV